MDLEIAAPSAPPAGIATASARVDDGFEIDAEDPRVVPAALAELVTASRNVVRVMEFNSHYSPRDAVAALEDTAAALGRLTRHAEPYVGDYSRTAATSMASARDLLRQARRVFSDARHDLALDATAPSAMPLAKVAPSAA
ncbi:hypothetical protein BJY16_001780 [Actinoplanes octamycinicus]|uniref:Uncharacterized protein n=1 Tax=Actinoplanes octamycinicus TaxID=135948 RepID=A0A7W7GU36_9ACTN|nr:hypothetical protein [Actinoplanes octamycinicus]MBB4738321.1 hypothetical protein [Actinoplanes octamycinicus]GIE57437.1 hypothetical protein Aoc01nite_28390 [Actinoplanes octamycinicus]